MERATVSEGNKVSEEKQGNAEKAHDLPGDGSIPDGDGKAMVGYKSVKDQNKRHSQQPEAGGNQPWQLDKKQKKGQDHPG